MRWACEGVRAFGGDFLGLFSTFSVLFSTFWARAKRQKMRNGIGEMGMPPRPKIRRVRKNSYRMANSRPKTHGTCVEVVTRIRKYVPYI